MAMARVTLQTVADRVGVSRMTVSNAFSRPDQLSPELRQRILAAADELGYVGPDPSARALARGTTSAVGILLTDSLRIAFTDEFAIRFLGAVADELAPTGLAITLLTTRITPEHDVNLARDVAIDGAIVYSCDPISEAVGWLTKRRLPLVFVDQVPAADIPSVNIDDEGGARATARHLIDLGHRRVGIVSSSATGPYGLLEDPVPRHGHVSIERMRGWLDELDGAGITPVVVQQPAYDPEAHAAAGRMLLDLPEPPTAIICFSDVVAHGVVRSAQERGLRVPEDLSVTGFDDSPLATRMSPQLTTVRQDVDAKGRAAVAALTAQLGKAAGGAAPAEHLVLPTELVVRASTAPPPAAA